MVSVKYKKEYKVEKVTFFKVGEVHKHTIKDAGRLAKEGYCDILDENKNPVIIKTTK